MQKRALIVGLTALLLLSCPLAGDALAAIPPDVNDAIAKAQTSGDTALILLCAALVLLMTPGLAFFYGGFVRSRNVLNTIMMSFLVMGVVGVTWVLWGYSLAFAPGLPFIGSLNWAFLNHVSLTDTSNYLPRMAYEASLANDKVVTSYAPTIPQQAHMIYQAMFAINIKAKLQIDDALDTFPVHGA